MLTGAAGAVVFAIITGGNMTLSALAWGAGAGLLGMFGTVLLFSAMAEGQFQVVSPIAAVTSAVVPVAAGLVAGEVLSAAGSVGALVVLPAIWLLAGGSRGKSDGLVSWRIVLMSLGAGCGFGGFFVLLARAPEGSGVIPLMFAKLTALAVMVTFRLLARQLLFPKQGAKLALGSGATDSVANLCFVLAAASGQLVIVGALTALFPASNAVLGVAV